MSVWSDIAAVLWPDCCEVCGRALLGNEKIICLECDTKMPRADFHLQSFSELHKRLASPNTPIERTASYFRYHRGSQYTNLIKRAKYNGRPELARKLGERFAIEIKDTGFFEDIDLLIPMPLHRFKLWKRGYNQAEEICRGIRAATGIDYGDNLKVKRHSTQTRKSASQRTKAMEGLISASYPEELQGQHILIIDDVITTGATMREAIRAIHELAPTARISVLSLAIAYIQ